MPMESFTMASRFPARRRATQACVACRMRKTRCDAVRPRCGFCALHNVDCVYRDSQELRVDYNTQVLLERIQLLEDRLVSNPSLGERGVEQPSQQPRSGDPPLAIDLDVQIPRSHTANANHVYSWPIVRQLLAKTAPDAPGRSHSDVTDVFFQPSAGGAEPAASSWRLYRDSTRTASQDRHLIHAYFSKVNVFFPLLSASDMVGIHEAVVVDDANPQGQGQPTVSTAQYALLLLVLCLASFMENGSNVIQLEGDDQRMQDAEQDPLWPKAKLLLGSISAEATLAAAQCSMLAWFVRATFLYSGARGKISESFHWAHAAAVKCETLARIYTQSSGSPAVPDEFSRLFWIAYIVEGDFVSEISATLPSGLSRYEDFIPYPTITTATSGEDRDPALVQQEEVVAFQITTNASIRRFLNRVNSAVYNAKEQQRQQSDSGADHALWLLRVAQDLWAHHAAVYRNLPGFLLTSNSSMAQSQASPNMSSPTAHITSLMPRGNDPWNILRLQGRYYAGQYIIHRPFVEYALLNASIFNTHPCKAPILECCRVCFSGCIGFIRVFDADPANSITCLFATGMV
ncbi:oleate-activated transcription factor 1 [Paramyrothecium foliicola]|nr:oleate-activated transcription factor 1 [Paramyrothecium foliicola]